MCRDRRWRTRDNPWKSRMNFILVPNLEPWSIVAIPSTFGRGTSFGLRAAQDSRIQNFRARHRSTQMSLGKAARSETLFSGFEKRQWSSATALHKLGCRGTPHQRLLHSSLFFEIFYPKSRPNSQPSKVGTQKGKPETRENDIRDTTAREDSTRSMQRATHQIRHLQDYRQ